MSSIAGIVLAGGRSIRMGSPKATLRWDTTTLLGHAFDTVRQAVDGPVVVALRSGQDTAPPSGATLVFDEGHGPLAALAAATHAATQVDRAVVCPIDMPFVTPRLLRTLAAALDDSHDVAVPGVAGTPRPMPMALRPAHVVHLDELVAAGHRSLRSLVVTSSTVLVPIDPAGAPHLLANLNTPQDYATALHRDGVQPTRSEAGRISA